MYEYNGLLLVGGPFEAYGTNASTGLIALNKNGTFNKSFVLPGGSSVSEITQQSNGKLILTGSFPFPAGRKTLIRLNLDYTVDATFTQSTYTSIYSVSVDEQDRMYFLGNNRIDGINYAVARLRADGTFDNTFNASLKFELSPNLHKIVALPGARVAIGGFFDVFNGEAHSGLVIVDELGNYVDVPFTFSYSSAAISLRYTDGALFAGGRFVNKDTPM